MRVLLLVGRGFLAGVVLVILSLAGCPKPGPAPVVPPDASDAAPAPHETCMEACFHLHSLGCDTDSACAQVCGRIKDQAFIDCLANVTSCQDVDRCDR